MHTNGMMKSYTLCWPKSFFNDVLQKELTRSHLKDRISSHAHSLSDSCDHHLYGSPLNKHYDGVHLRGPAGMKFLTMSLCKIFQKVFKKHARSRHNHNLPVLNDRPPRILPTPAPHLSSSPSHHKPESVVIDIKLPQQPPGASFIPPISDSIPMYSVPTYNFFDSLGN